MVKESESAKNDAFVQFTSSEADQFTGTLTVRRSKMDASNVTALEFFDGNTSKICETP